MRSNQDESLSIDEASVRCVHGNQAGIEFAQGIVPRISGCRVSYGMVLGVQSIQQERVRVKTYFRSIPFFSAITGSDIPFRSKRVLDRRSSAKVMPE